MAPQPSCSSNRNLNEPSTSTSTRLNNSSLTSSLITVYYKPIPLPEPIEIHEEITYRQKHPSLGPFHPFLGPVPPEATISRQIFSSTLRTLLEKFVTIAADFLEPPESFDIPDFEERIAAFKTRWPYILHNIYLPAEVYWQDKAFFTPEHLDRNVLNIFQWKNRQIQQPLTENALKEWDETIIYPDIILLLYQSYAKWRKYSHDWLIEMEYIDAIIEFDKKRSKASARERKFSPITYETPKPTSLSHYLPRSDPKQYARYAIYGYWKQSTDYPVPSTPLILEQSITPSLLRNEFLLKRQ